jgi:hypothetical protein
MYQYGVVRVAFCIIGWSFCALLGNAFSARPTTSSLHQTVPRIKREKFDPFEDYYRYFKNVGRGGGEQEEDCGRPLLIEGVLSSEECQACCDRLMAAADTLQVDLQEQTLGRETQLYQCTLAQAVDVIMRESTSELAYLTFCEGLLDEADDDEGLLQEVQQWATAAKEGLFGNDTDWFDFFPSWAQPTDAVILAGAGATSTLHRDPMEWTGTSLCLEGTKVWRFLEPPPPSSSSSSPPYPVGDKESNSLPRVAALDQTLHSYRLDSIAWDSDDDDDENSSTALSAGWQSDFSLYHTRDHDTVPSAESLAELEDDERYALLDKLALSSDILKPNVPSSITIHTVIQKPGDLLLIPAHWWHQTYAFEPSVAIASQRCGRRDAELVFQHILEKHHQQGDEGTNHHGPNSFLDNASKSPEDMVADLFSHLQAMR